MRSVFIPIQRKMRSYSSVPLKDEANRTITAQKSITKLQVGDFGAKAPRKPMIISE